MSVKCEQPLDEPTVQVWLLYLHPNFNYWTFFVSGTELGTDEQTDGRTDDPITRCPRRTFQAGGIISGRGQNKNELSLIGYILFQGIGKEFMNNVLTLKIKYDLRSSTQL